MIRKEEKKVEYLELIYDLIFVYIIGRNNSLLHQIEGGFVSGDVIMPYVFCTLAVIQIWNFSTFYINLYGRNGVRDHVFLFINMYLLYHMADGIGAQWQSSFDQFCGAWLLILVNLGAQHILELRHHGSAPWEAVQIRRKAAILFIEAGLVGAHMIVYHLTGVSIAYVPVVFGIAATGLSGRINMIVPVDFAHLTERAMLYVVFTFGEMIIAITAYFTGDLTPNNLYFSLMAFLIVVGLFLSYEVLYNRIIDRTKITNGMGYMMIHVFLIFALNNISVSLEFMRETEVALLPKVLFLTGSFVLYFVFLFLTTLYAKDRSGFHLKFALLLTAITAVFAALMFVFMRQMIVNIAVSVIFVFVIFALLYQKGRQVPEEGPDHRVEF